MRVLTYLHYYPPARFVGGELMTADLLEYLAVQGHEVHVYAEYVDEGYARNGVTVLNSGRLYRALAEQYDVFVTHPEIRTLVWAHTQRMPYVGIVHNLNHSTVKSLERQPPDLTLANSEWTAERVPEAVHRTGMGVHVMHPPVTITPSAPASGQHYTMINISPDKGGWVLNRVANLNRDLTFQAVAGGHGEQMWEQPGNVEMIPQGTDMDAVYTASRALLFPSRVETYGKVVAEAMQYGLPVIASDLPGIREAGGDAPVYLDPYDETAWDHWVNEVRNPDVHRSLSVLSQQRATILRDRTRRDLARWAEMIEAVGQ